MTELISTVLRLRLADRLDRLVADLRPVLRSPGPTSGSAEVVRLERRRVESAGSLDVPVCDLAHRHAQTVAGALENAGVDWFLVGRTDGGLRLGLGLGDRPAALRALAAAATGTGWFLTWDDGPRSGTVPLGRATRSRHVRRARTWNVFEVRSWGPVAVGREQAVEIGFWEPGASGQLELVGTRGQERFHANSAPTVEVVDGREYRGRSAFPVGRALERFDGPVDVVVTWVDGGEDAWQERFRRTAQAEGRRLDESALDAARYEVRDELRYLLRSVWAHCGWVRRIHLVTAGQVPDWFVADDRIRLVDHGEIIPDDALPTFNSHSIEASLHRIDGLAEHVLYFNDDMFVARPVRPDLFFTSNGLPRVFASDARVPGVEDDTTLAVDTAALRGRSLLDERFGRVVEYKPMHSPYPQRTSVTDEAEREFSEIFDRTVHSRFRSPSDLSVAASFAQHYALATGRAVLGEIGSEYVNVESGRLGWHLDRIRLDPTIDTFCLNATSAGVAGQEERDALVASFLEERFPIPSPWERRPSAPAEGGPSPATAPTSASRSRSGSGPEPGSVSG